MRVSVWLLLTIIPCFALHESDAGKVDWHKPLIGIPRTESLAVAPKFQLVAGKNKRSVVITVSKSNVLAAINAPDGEIAWRQVLDHADFIGLYKSNPGFVVTLSGPGGAMLRSYNVSNGDLVFESQLHKPHIGRLSEPASIGQAIMFSVDDTNDIFTLTNAHTIQRINGYTGKAIWSWTSEDQTSSVLYSKLVMTKSTVFTIGLVKSLKSYTLHIVSLDASNGHQLFSIDVPSSISSPSDFLALTSSKSPSPILIWLDEGSHVKSLVLQPELTLKVKTLRSEIYREIKDTGTSDAGIFVALKGDGTAHVLRIVKSLDAVDKVWEFDNSADSSDVSESTYVGGFDWAGQPYVGRYYWSHAHQNAALHVLAANGPDGQPLVTGFTFSFEPHIHGHVQHYSIEVANPDPYRYFARAIYTTSAGTMQQWLQSDVQWTRDESLANVKAVEFVDLPEKEVTQSALGLQSFVTRITRHLEDARNLPQYITHFVRRFLLGSTATKIRASAKKVKKTPDPLWRDEFGFRKILVIATSTGKVFGIDSDGGHIVWSRYLVEAMSSDVSPLKIFTSVSVSDGKQPEVVLLANRKSLSSKTAVVYRFEALTGRNLGVQPNVLSGVELFQGGMLEAYMLRNDNRTIIIVGEDHKIHLYPSKASTHSHFENISPRLFFTLETTDHHLTGHQIGTRSEDDTYSIYTTWRASIDPSERIQAVIKRPHEPVASLGKVLGDRSTLYKYLNPHLTAILTVSRTSTPSCGVYLMDGARGNVLYHTKLPAAGNVCNVHCALTENWFVYHYYDPGSSGNNSTKGFRLVSVELYEGAGVDDKTGSADLTSYSYNSSLITTFQRSFVYTAGVTALAMTSTKFGITSKDLLVANTYQQVQTIPRRFLDPRRPHNKPTAQELEEWLIQYDPVLANDPRRVISHNYHVAGTSHIVTSPALLESTSIVLSYGIDLFLTRVAPSKTFDILSENFNKVQLVLTVGALVAGIMVTRPIVRRKIRRQRWYYS